MPRLTALLCALLLATTSWAQSDVPPLTGRVMDPAEILSDATERSLTDMLRAHEDSSGNQIVIATVASLDGEAIEEYALRAGRAWQIGTEENDNGILVIVAPNERKVRIEVGYGLEGAVPDAVAAQIIRNEIIPAFRGGDFDAGVSAGAMALLEAVEGEYDAGEGGGEGPPPVLARALFALLFAFVLCMISFAALMAGPVWRWVIMVLLTPIAFVVGGAIGFSIWAGVLSSVVYIAAFAVIARRPGMDDLRKRMKEAAKKGDKVPVAVGPFTFHVGGASSSGGSGGFGGGGGFSGGGGSFGGGGATGGW